MDRYRFLASAIVVLFLISGCGNETDLPDAPTSIERRFEQQEMRISTPPSYELLSARRDGWDVEARVRTPQGVRDLHFALRLDGERCTWTGAVRDGSELVWSQTFEAALDGSVLQVEETDGFDLLRFEVLAGDRENYTLVLADSEVRHYSVPVGANDWKGWSEFWPATGLDWNADAALCNGVAQGRILRDEMADALGSHLGTGDPQYLHPLMERACAVIRACVTMKCRAGGNANQICAGCMMGDSLCELLHLIFG